MKAGDLVVDMKHGSHLYGTATASSDIDYKGIALPTTQQVLLGRIPNIIESTNNKKGNGEKNKPGAVDREVYSLHYFIKLALEGQTPILDMLHAPKEALVHVSDVWDELQANRSRFYTKNMSALVGYARHQAAKYGLKGSRLAAVKLVREFIASTAGYDSTIGDIIDLMPRGEHIHLHDAAPEHNNIRLYEVCGMKMQATARAAHYLPTLDKYIASYGARAKLAETNEGVDWKAVSHAFRAAYQTRAILVDGGFTYPLRETNILMQVKRGELPYKEAGPMLEALIDEVERLSRESSLPEKADVVWAEDFLVATTERSIF